MLRNSRPRTSWSPSNAFTSGFKEPDPDLTELAPLVSEIRSEES